MDALRQQLAAGEPLLGAWVSMTDAQGLEIMAKAGYDFLLFDTQHGAMTWERLLPSMQAIGQVPTLVRLGWRSPEQIMRALDLGAAGVVVPMVSTADDAQLAVQASRYPPSGYRSFGPVRNYYAAQAAGLAEPLCFAMIETAEAMQNLDAIAATPGLDGLFVGPVDLALSLGFGAALVMPPEILAAISQIVAACERHGIVAGCAGLGMANVEALLQRGVRFVATGSDAGHLRRAATADAEQARTLKSKLCKQVPVAQEM